MGKYAKLIKAYKDKKNEKFKEIFGELAFIDVVDMVQEQHPDSATVTMIKSLGGSHRFVLSLQNGDRASHSNPLMTAMLKDAFSDAEVYSNVFEHDKIFKDGWDGHRQALLTFLEISPLYFSKKEWQGIESALVKQVIARFNGLIPGMEQLLAFAVAFQEARNALADHIVSDFTLCDKFINSLNDLYTFIGIFPQTILELVPYLLAKTDKFQQVVKSASDLDIFISILSKYTPTPEKLDKLVSKIFEIYESDFKRLITSLDDIDTLHRRHPSSTAFLVKHVLNHQDEYDRLIKNSHDQQRLSSLIMYCGSAVLDREARHKLSAETIDEAKKHSAKKRQSSYDPRLLPDKKAKKEALAQHDSNEKVVEKAATLTS